MTWAAAAAGALAEARVRDRELDELRARRDALANQSDGNPETLAQTLAELADIETRIHELGG